MRPQAPMRWQPRQRRNRLYDPTTSTPVLQDLPGTCEEHLQDRGASLGMRKLSYRLVEQRGGVEMNILMLDTDSKWGNLYLMQLSAHHKQRGDEVSMIERGDPDKVYISCLFTKNRSKALGIAKMFTCPVLIGGTGINFECGDKNIVRLKPDYDLYPSKESLGRTTLGCIRKCPWCVVPEKEGHIQKWMHPSEFYDERFDVIHLLDNNILAMPDWFMETSNWIIDHDLKLHEGGMDIRLLTPKLARQLRRVKFTGLLHFAWDLPRTEKEVLRGIQLLKDAGFDTRRETSVYILTNFNTSIKEDLHRIITLRNLDVSPFVMLYGKYDKLHHDLARRVNRKAIFWSDTWLDGFKNEVVR